MIVNPAMIMLGRESRGWTQGDLAKAIQTIQGTISKYEAGLLHVTHAHLESISRSLRFDQSFFFLDEQLFGLGGDFLYRKKANVSAKTLRRVQAEANIRNIQTRVILRHVDPPDYLDFPAIQPEEVSGRIERLARRVREALRVPRGPIRNVTRTIENAGAIVFTVDFGTDSIDGTNIRSPGLPPLLFLNKNVSGERHRFNLAHELGHAVMHFSTSLNDAEDEANHFAREFLMPFDEIRSDLRNLDLSAAARLKQFWGVSMQAIITQARCLKQITESQYRRMFTQLSVNGFRKEEPFPLKFEQPELFDSLRNTYSGRLGLSEDDLGHLLFTNQLGVIDPLKRGTSQLRLVQGTLFEDN